MAFKVANPFKLLHWFFSLGYYTHQLHMQGEGKLSFSLSSGSNSQYFGKIETTHCIEAVTFILWILSLKGSVLHKNVNTRIAKCSSSQYLTQKLHVPRQAEDKQRYFLCIFSQTQLWALVFPEPKVNSLYLGSPHHPFPLCFPSWFFWTHMLDARGLQHVVVVCNLPRHRMKQTLLLLLLSIPKHLVGGDYLDFFASHVSTPLQTPLYCGLLQTCTG